jgi:hypothetical protein
MIAYIVELPDNQWRINSANYYCAILKDIGEDCELININDLSSFELLPDVVNNKYKYIIVDGCKSLPIDVIKQINIPKFHVFGDTPHDDLAERLSYYYNMTFVQSRWLLQEYNATQQHQFKSTPKWWFSGVEPREIMPGYLHTKVRPIDIFFAGSPTPKRRIIYDKLKSSLGHLKIEFYGEGWPNGPISREDVIRFYQESKIVLNDHINELCFPNHRTFAAPANGALLATDKIFGVDELFNEPHEILTYTDADNLVDKLRYWFKHVDILKEIAYAGMGLVLNNYTVRNNFCQAVGEINLYLDGMQT